MARTVIETIYIDPGEKLDYQFDWSDWLVGSDTIATSAVALDGSTGPTISLVSDTDTTVTFWIEGVTLGTSHLVKCDIVTSDSREGTRRVQFICIKK